MSIPRSRLVGEELDLLVVVVELLLGVLLEPVDDELRLTQRRLALVQRPRHLLLAVVPPLQRRLPLNFSPLSATPQTIVQIVKSFQRQKQSKRVVLSLFQQKQHV